MTNVLDLERVAVVAPIGNSDHSSLSAVISIAQAVLPWRNICLADNPVVVLNEHLSLLAGRYVPTKVIHVRNKDKPWFDDQCRHDF